MSLNMNLILITFMFLAVFKFCASEPDCIEDFEESMKNDNSTIFLLVPNSMSNEECIRLLRHIKTVVNIKNYKLKIITEFFPGGVNGTLQAVQYIPNLINLYVNDFFESNYATILENNVFFAGKTLKKYDTNCTDNGLEPLRDAPDTCYNAKLISESITDFVDLYNFILRYSSGNNIDTNEYYLMKLTEDYRDHPEILVCSDLDPNTIQNINILSYHFGFNIKHINNNKCNQFITRVQQHKTSHRPVAILAAKPDSITCETTIPILFYNQAYLSYEDKAMFPNSMSVIRKWNPLKHAFLEIMRQMKWKRVAMISDDSEYSEEFEIEMSHVLDSNGIAYHSYLCSEKKCDFKKTLKSLEEAHPRIIILNIGERNAENFVRSIRHKMIKYSVWLVRDWPFAPNSKFTETPIYSISLGTDNSDQDITDRVHIERISTGIKRTINSYRNLKYEGLSITRKNMFRELTNTLPEVYYINAFINEISNNKYEQELKMIIRINHLSGVNVINGKDFHIKNRDRKKCDIVEAENFLEPCGDEDFLLIFLVITIFCIVLLLVTYYINNVAYTNSYTNL